ncbi:hypothetical protein EUGRSUZ_L00863 [Eucalyptus grandis]|uniref:Leucine-rich repeat-containing N-terminal plant-type domain-containing protein n=1 Tax=Eucalyptus grandis TaxID=71139 RepID=A0A058ZWR1_EUCGR|nr:hypothetical protein EUGRSUZ_L00863 [Eucalyptus grandis]
MGWCQILGLLCFLLSLHTSLPFASPLCRPHQRDALLHFKDSFMLDSKASRSCHLFRQKILHSMHTCYPKTKSWNKGVDCCSWDGVTCDSVTSNIVGLNLSCSWLRGALHPNSSLLLLHHLQSLDLSCNDFASSHILPNLSAFPEMTYLNLSISNFSGTIPSEISCLSKLVALDLSFSSLKLEGLVFTRLVQNLTTVRELVLDEVNMSMVSPMSFANLSSSLTYLTIAGCSLEGVFPYTIFRKPRLTTLDICFNENLFGILPKTNWTGPLVSLSLESTSFSGEIPSSIGNMKSLTVLDLGMCKFTGHIPSSMADLKQLQVLDLTWNDFSGFLDFEILADLKQLQVLDLSGIDLNGFLDFEIFMETRPKYTFSKLQVVGLSFCNLTKFPYFLNSSKRLTCLDLSVNRISGEIPKWFWGISHDTLEIVDLSNNLLVGGIQQALPSSICQLSSLQLLDLSNNNLSGNMPQCFGIHWKQLSELYLQNNSFQGPLPSSICQLSSLKGLDLSKNNFLGNMPQCFVLSHNQLSDIFPCWLEAPYLYQLDLEDNKFHGRINFTDCRLPFPTLVALSIANNNFIGQWPTKVLSNTSMHVIDLSNNNFEGLIPLPSPTTFYYSIASNKMTGKIPPLICNATKLEIIDLSNNGLIGTLPRCLTNFSTKLSVLNLQMNHLKGKIPQSFCWRNNLTTLDLSQNWFEGTLPRSLVNCKYLEVVDLSDNQIEDAFPTWLGTLPELKVLILRSNNFENLLNIPKGAHLFSKLHILDLSNNNFGGPLPANLIMNFKAMMDEENGQDKPLYMQQDNRGYEASVNVTMKGLVIELVKILTIFTTIDLSHNSFQGDIPKVFGHLHSLIGLNLSHNHLTSSIPPTLGNLVNLEWLDLSSNELSGEIPGILGDLAFLECLNLSNNQLTGRIPQEKQLSTFSSNSFGGNPGLCGSPLRKACLGDAQPPPPSSSSSSDHEEHESLFKRKAMWIGYVSGIVIGISITYIALEMGRPGWLTRGVGMLERRVAKWMEMPNRKAIKFYGQ